jgi:hypothetical protein
MVGIDDVVTEFKLDALNDTILFDVYQHVRFCLGNDLLLFRGPPAAGMTD